MDSVRTEGQWTSEVKIGDWRAWLSQGKCCTCVEAFKPFIPRLSVFPALAPQFGDTARPNRTKGWNHSVSFPCSNRPLPMAAMSTLHADRPPLAPIPRTFPHPTNNAPHDIPYAYPTFSLSAPELVQPSPSSWRGLTLPTNKDLHDSPEASPASLSVPDIPLDFRSSSVFHGRQRPLRDNLGRPKNGNEDNKSWSSHLSPSARLTAQKRPLSSSSAPALLSNYHPFLDHYTYLYHSTTPPISPPPLLFDEEPNSQLHVRAQCTRYRSN
jgi:hypothetical protein